MCVCVCVCVCSTISFSLPFYLYTCANCIQIDLKDDKVYSYCVKLNHAVLCVPPYEDILGVMKTGAKKGLFDDDVRCTELSYRLLSRCDGRKEKFVFIRSYRMFFPHECVVTDD